MIETKMNIRIAIVGAAGRTGRQLVRAICQSEGVVLGAALERKDSPFVGTDAGTLSGPDAMNIMISDDLDAVANDFDILIDFTRPEVSLNHLNFCLKHKKRLVLGTTGFDEAGKLAIQRAAVTVPIVFTANFSIGVNVVLKLVSQTARAIGNHSDIEIFEIHNRDKEDTPSGTALEMGEAIANALGRDLKNCAVYSGNRSRNSIGFASLRAGDVIGENTAIFADTGERIEITHKASDRMIYAKGAVLAAQWLSSKKEGLYTMQDVLNLKDL